ncbi:hypothetical protein D3C75_811990 [compost metagenome]
MAMNGGLFVLVGDILQCAESVGEFQCSTEREKLLFYADSDGQEAKLERTDEHIRREDLKMNGLPGHIQSAGQVVDPGKPPEGIPVLLPGE